MLGSVAHHLWLCITKTNRGGQRFYVHIYVKSMYNIVKTRLCNNEWLRNAFFFTVILIIIYLFIWPLWLSCFIDFLYNVENRMPPGTASTPPLFHCIIMLNIHVLLAKWTQIYTHVL